jgi:hypothetical protein
MTAHRQHLPFESIRVNEVEGRYFPPDLLEGLLTKYLPSERVTQGGYSVQGQPIYLVRLGSGPTRILMWSQMHGNESTTTKAVMDLMRYLLLGPCQDTGLLSRLELCLIPMLNPDGARAYTRENANQVDLNRDAAERTQPESRLLRRVFEEFRPDFCFNLHDQRSIYGVGETPVSATLSFLAPAADKERSFTPARETAMKLIAGLHKRLQQELPGGIGRYDDSFNANCVGDQFQLAGVPTLLFEAGHYPEDYAREATRRFAFTALLESLHLIATKTYLDLDPELYADIPENSKSFADILIKQPYLLSSRFAGMEILALHYEEILREGAIHLLPSAPEPVLTRAIFGHVWIDASRPEDRERLLSQPALSKLFL